MGHQDVPVWHASLQKLSFECLQVDTLDFTRSNIVERKHIRVCGALRASKWPMLHGRCGSTQQEGTVRTTIVERQSMDCEAQGMGGLAERVNTPGDQQNVIVTGQLIAGSPEQLAKPSTRCCGLPGCCEWPGLWNSGKGTHT